MPQDRSAVVSKQTQFYRHNFRRLLKFAFILLGLAYILLGVVVYQHFAMPQQSYFATTSDGRLIEIKPLTSQE